MNFYGAHQIQSELEIGQEGRSDRLVGWGGAIYGRSQYQLPMRKPSEICNCRDDPNDGHIFKLQLKNYIIILTAISQGNTDNCLLPHENFNQ